MTNLTNKLFLPVFLLLLSISPAYAHNDTFFNSPHKLELKPASVSEPGYHLVRSYWLGGADIDLRFKGDDDDTVCQARGYTKDPCQGNKVPVKYCGSGNKYHLCGCDTSVYRYTSQNCPGISMPNNDVCDGLSSGCDCSGYGSGYIWNETECVFSCSVDSDCSGGQVCNISNGQCYECVYDKDCGTNETCNNHRCEAVDLCAGVNCAGGQSCNTDTGQCECPSGEVFYENQCQAPSCKNDAVKCSGNTPVCADNGKCVECISAENCGANEICSGNTCQTVDRCKDVSCTGGKSCNPDNGICICPSGKIDNNGTCETPNCANGGTTCKGSTPQCTTDGRCVECIKDGDCSGAGEKCLSNTCQTVDRCAGVNCSGGKTCNPDNGICICPSGKIDNNGTCEAPNCTNGGVTCSGVNSVCNTSTKQCVQCTANSHCSGGKTCQSNSCSCPSSKPYTTTGGVCVECTSDSHCSGSKECNENHQCILPADPCEGITCTNGTCSNGTCQCNNGFHPLDVTTCVECTQDSHCNSGKVCLNSSCVVDRDCQVGDIFYRDGVCSDIYDEKRGLLAVVVDPSRRLLVFIGERPSPVSSSPNDASYRDVSTVSNEEIGDFFERGFINSQALAKSDSPQRFCLNLGSEALMNGFYTPGGGEIFILSENAAKVEETLNFLKTKNNTAAGIIGTTIFTSDEYVNDPTKMIAATITKAGTNFWPSFKAVDKTDSKTTLRCFARYKCKSTDAAKCKITPYAVGTDPHTSYVKTASLPGKTGCTLEVFRWNTDYKRYIVLENNANSSLCRSSSGGSGGGSTDPQKTPCQPGDYLYAVTTTENALCSPSLVSSRTLLGRVLYTSGDGTGVVLHHKITSNVASRNSASGSSLCSAYKLEIPNAPGGDWRLANIDELRKNSNWESYIQGSSTTYFWIKYTSLPYLFNLKGDGPLSPGSTSERHPGICTSSFWTAYRK